MQLTDTIEVGGHHVTVRSAHPEDAAFLCRVFASTRESELARVPWSQEDKQRFIAHQFHAQDHDYRRNFQDALFLVLVVDGSDAGRLYLHRRPDELHIIEIALLPAFRNGGIGTALLRHILAEGAIRSVRVTIYVELLNPAMKLYRRLGFQTVREDQVYMLMEWRPDTPGPTDTMNE